MNRKILIMGLPGAGKTTLAEALAARLGGVHFNADSVRANLNQDLGFSLEDRIEQARRMGWLCDQVVRVGGTAIADFVCPTMATRLAFGGGDPFALVFVNRITSSRFPDTDAMFVPVIPGAVPYGMTVVIPPGLTVEAEVEMVLAGVSAPGFDERAPTALFIGRYQPFHDGHKALIVRGIERYGQACIAVRTMPVSENNPFTFDQVRRRIEVAMAEYGHRISIIRTPNVASVMYGRDVGYKIEHIELDADTQAISATKLRSTMAR